MQEVRLDRRKLLGLFGTSTAVALPGCVTTGSFTRPVRFEHGVASGDPADDGAVIWTRASVVEQGYSDVTLRWHVSSAPGAPAVRSGSAVARAAADHTTKVVVTGLEAGRDYWYRFEGPDGTISPEGRFRTLPVGVTERVVLAIASCQLYPGGYFNAYQHMASAERLDAVLMLGDYIYEYGPEGYGSESGHRLGRLPDPPRETVTLADYRLRHAQVKADPQMQSAHARAAFICVWDDHEVTNDGWIAGAENHQPQTEGDWEARKAAAMQAYFEWMPIREPGKGRGRDAIYRSFEFGSLATIAMVETRLLKRDQQAAPKNDIPATEQISDILATLAQPQRELMGAEQSRWLEGVLSRSVGAGKPWQVLGNQVIMARVAGPDFLAALGSDEYAALLTRLPAQYRQRIAHSQTAYQAGVPFNLDAWDGYPHARERLYQLFGRAGARPLVVSGDSHAAWANNLHDKGGTLRALEAGCTAISSPSYGSILPRLGPLLSNANSEVAYCNQDAKGYTLLTLTQTEARMDFVTVSTVLEREFETSIDRSFTTGAGPAFSAWKPA